MRKTISYLTVRRFNDIDLLCALFAVALAAQYGSAWWKWLVLLGWGFPATLISLISRDLAHLPKQPAALTIRQTIGSETSP